MPGLGVVLNPYARGNLDRKERAGRLRDIVGRDGVVAETDSLAAIDEAAREFRERGVDVIAICGGDGTLFRTITSFCRVYGDEPLPKIVPLRAGTMNVVAASIRCIHGSPERVLAHVSHDYRRGGTYVTVERELLAVNGAGYGFLFGLGMIVNFLRVYYTSPRPGPLRAAGLVGRYSASAIFRTSLARSAFQPFDADIDVDGERVPFRRFTTVLVMAIPELPLGFRPGYLAGRKRGHFHFLGGPIPATTIVRNLLRFRRGRPVREDSLYDNLAREVQIVFDRPTHYMVDADILGPVEGLRLCAGPRVTLIRG